MSTYEDASLILPISAARKAGKIYSLKPTDGTGGFTVVSSSCDEIDSTGASTPVVANMPRYDYKADYVAPTDNSYYGFNGGSDNISLPNPLVSPLTNPFSGIYRFKTGSDVSTFQVIDSISFDSNNRLSIGILSGYFVFTTYDGTTSNSVNYPVLANTDYQFGVSKDNTHTDKEIYLNGVLVSTTSAFNLTTYSTLSRVIGSTYLSINGFLGNIYKAEDYNYKLSSQEFLDRYNGLPIPEKYKGVNGLNSIVNPDFVGSSVGWVLNPGWTYNIGTSDVTFSGTGTGQLQTSIVSSYDGEITLTYEVISSSISGSLLLFTGKPENNYISLSKTVGVHTKKINTNGSNFNDLSFFVSGNVTGTITLSNILSVKSGNTLNLSTGKTASTWYDLDHAIEGAVTGATLTDSIDFGNNVHSLETCPVLLTEPGFTNLFINSRTPVTQTITTVIGTTYTVNCKNTGIITIEETGGNGQGGAATEVNPYTYTATATSVTITLEAGHSFDWVQLSDTAYAMNHVETAGVSVTKIQDQITGSGDVNTFNSDSLVLEISLRALFDDQTTRVIGISDGTSNNRMRIGYTANTNSLAFALTVGGVEEYSFNTTIADITNNSVFKLKCKTNDFGSKIDGVEVDSSASGTMAIAGTFDTMEFANGAGSLYMNAKTKYVQVYKGIDNY